MDEKRFEAIIYSFCLWLNGEPFSDRQKKWLSENTTIDDYNYLSDFYADLGFLDENGNITDIGRESVEAWKQGEGRKAAQSVGTQTRPGDDRREEWETERMTPEEWEANNYYAVEICEVDAIPLDDRTKRHWRLVIGYDDYISARDDIHNKNWYICDERFQTEKEYFPGLLTIDDYIKTFEDADDNFLQLPSFPEFSKRMKIKMHDTIILAADTGAGKSSLAINFLNDLNDRYPVLYINLEMDKITILRRLVAIRTGLEIDRIEGYKKDERTRETVNNALRVIASRKPLQILEDVYYLEDLESIIARTTKGRAESTIVIIDHALLMKTKTTKSDSYERATMVSEGLRRISRKYNIIMLSLLQQNRAGKGDGSDTKRPTNSSLKASGSWENDSTHVIFLWHDPQDGKKKIIITKNRTGDDGDFVLNYWKKTQIYTESKEQASNINRTTKDLTGRRKQSGRDKKREKYFDAIESLTQRTGGGFTTHDLAEELGVSTATVRGYLKEFGGVTMDGQPIDPAGIDTTIEKAFLKLSPLEDSEIPFQAPDEINFG